MNQYNNSSRVCCVNGLNKRFLIAWQCCNTSIPTSSSLASLVLFFIWPRKSYKYNCDVRFCKLHSISKPRLSNSQDPSGSSPVQRNQVHIYKLIADTLRNNWYAMRLYQTDISVINTDHVFSCVEMWPDNRYSLRSI